MMGKRKSEVHEEVVDTDLPDDHVDYDAFKALQENYEGDPDD